MSILGKLNWESLQHGPLAGIGLVNVGIASAGGFLLLVAAITYFRLWGRLKQGAVWIWKNWLTSLDPKKIGVMYLIVSGLMLVRGLSDALMMRAQQASSVGGAHGVMDVATYQQVFTAHGTIMIFFVAMGFMFGLINLIVPLQIGARDVAFPFMNSVSFWLYAAGVLLINVSLVVGEFAATGWLAYPPLSELAYSPGVGVDYWIWCLQIAGIGSLLSGINFGVTILKLRAAGMSLMKMPIFIWSVLVTMVMIMFAFPILTASLSLLALDRTLGMHFFTSGYGGNPMMYVNLIWAWGHPEVYILVLPAFGIFSEVVPVFSRKRLFGYTSMVWALVAIAVLSFLVWLHHFFTMGAGANVNAFFGIMTAVIAVPTGVKVFNWMFTMYRGRIRFTTPMLWFIGFVATFTIGGLTGVLMSVPAIDFQMHNSLFLVAHFHNMIIGGVLFGYFAGFTYWFPKMFGFTLNERLGRYAFWSWITGFILAFGPLYILGMMGATRRLDHYDASLGWQAWFIVAGIGVVIICIGVFFQILQLIVSIKQRHSHLDTSGDPWGGRTLEWSTSSPAPEYNFAVLPHVTGRDPFWEAKQAGPIAVPAKFTDIEVPKNSSVGIIIAFFGFFACFAVVWHMWWLALLGLCGVIICLILRLTDDDTTRVIPAAEIAADYAKGSRS
jgi:cytochrome o ubiquinol oxidase subunit 1